MIILEDISQLITESQIKKGTIKTLFKLFKKGYKPNQITNRHIDVYRDRRFK